MYDVKASGGGENTTIGWLQGRIQEFSWPVSEDGMKTEGEARIEGAARAKIGGGVWGGGSVSPSPENFCKIVSEMVQSGAYFTSKLPG